MKKDYAPLLVLALAGAVALLALEIGSRNRTSNTLPDLVPDLGAEETTSMSAWIDRSPSDPQPMDLMELPIRVGEEEELPHASGMGSVQLVPGSNLVHVLGSKWQFIPIGYAQEGHGHGEAPASGFSWTASGNCRVAVEFGEWELVPIASSGVREFAKPERIILDETNPTEVVWVDRIWSLDVLVLDRQENPVEGAWVGWRSANAREDWSSDPSEWPAKWATTRTDAYGHAAFNHLQSSVGSIAAWHSESGYSIADINAEEPSVITLRLIGSKGWKNLQLVDLSGRPMGNADIVLLDSPGVFKSDDDGFVRVPVAGTSRGLLELRGPEIFRCFSFLRDLPDDGVLVVPRSRKVHLWADTSRVAPSWTKALLSVESSDQALGAVPRLDPSFAVLDVDNPQCVVPDACVVRVVAVDDLGNFWSGITDRKHDDNRVFMTEDRSAYTLSIGILDFSSGFTAKAFMDDGHPITVFVGEMPQEMAEIHIPGRGRCALVQIEGPELPQINLRTTDYRRLAEDQTILLDIPPSGPIRIQIKDLSGVVLPGAEVSLHRNETGATYGWPTSNQNWRLYASGMYAISGVDGIAEFPCVFQGNYKAYVQFPSERAVDRGSPLTALDGFDLSVGPEGASPNALFVPKWKHVRLVALDRDTGDVVDAIEIKSLTGLPGTKVQSATGNWSGWAYARDKLEIWAAGYEKVELDVGTLGPAEVSVLLERADPATVVVKGFESMNSECLSLDLRVLERMSMGGGLSTSEYKSFSLTFTSGNDSEVISVRPGGAYRVIARTNEATWRVSDQDHMQDWNGLGELVIHIEPIEHTVK